MKENERILPHPSHAVVHPDPPQRINTDQIITGLSHMNTSKSTESPLMISQSSTDWSTHRPAGEIRANRTSKDSR